MLDKYFQLKDKQVHYTVEGGRMGSLCRPVVLLHGFTEAVFVWENLCARLSKEGFYAIAVDMAGHGQTDAFSDVHTMELQAEIVRAVLREEQLEKAVIIGHSMGGYVAAAFACMYPENTLGVGFFHSNPAADTPQGAENRRRMLKLLEAGHVGFMGEFTAGLFAEGTADRYPEAMEALRASCKNMGADKVAAAQKGMLQRQGRLQVYNLNVPFLFIIGKLDQKADIPKLLAQTVLPVQAHVLTLPCGHMGMYEAPVETENFIVGYLRSISF